VTQTVKIQTASRLHRVASIDHLESPPLYCLFALDSFFRPVRLE